MALYKTPSQPEIKRIQLEGIQKYQHSQRLFKLSRLKTRRNFHLFTFLTVHFWPFFRSAFDLL